MWDAGAVVYWFKLVRGDDGIVRQGKETHTLGVRIVGMNPKGTKGYMFGEGLNLVIGLEVGFGGVWVGAAPYLMFIPDKDGDDIVTIADHLHYLGATPHGGNSKSDSAGGVRSHLWRPSSYGRDAVAGRGCFFIAKCKVGGGSCMKNMDAIYCGKSRAKNM